MSLTTLTALSPLDGRYADKVAPLRPIFSEFGLMHRRVQVEIEWLLALAAAPEVPELAPFAPAQLTSLRALASGFGTAEGERVKAIEATNDHYIICGFGRVGRQVARDLDGAGAYELPGLWSLTKVAQWAALRLALEELGVSA